jgi:hypothetical protein
MPKVFYLPEDVIMMAIQLVAGLAMEKQQKWIIICFCLCVFVSACVYVCLFFIPYVLIFLRILP